MGLSPSRPPGPQRDGGRRVASGGVIGRQARPAGGQDRHRRVVVLGDGGEVQRGTPVFVELVQQGVAAGDQPAATMFRQHAEIARDSRWAWAGR